MTGRQHFDEALAKVEAIPCWALLAGDLVQVVSLHELNGHASMPDNNCEDYARQCEAILARAAEWPTRCDAKNVPKPWIP